MLRAIRSRVTYANVTATAALFLALGGGAYALSGIPDRAGVYHGCVNPKAGGLRVVKSASSCRKTKTIRRGRRHVRVRGESAIAWNQKGPRGLRGTPGIKGDQGPQGDLGAPGTALAFARVFATGGVDEARTQGAGLTDANVTRPTTGIYCFYDLGFTPRNLQATADFAANRISNVLIGDSSGCAGTEDVFVQWTQRSDGTSQNTAFYILFN
jgi:hypothetical protein